LVSLDLAQIEFTLHWHVSSARTNQWVEPLNQLRDNAVAESFFSVLKKERIRKKSQAFSSQQQSQPFNWQPSHEPRVTFELIAAHCKVDKWRPGPQRATIPAGGWGSANTTTSLLRHEHVLLKGGRVVMHQNKPDGIACVSCSWAKPAHPHSIEACENGIKATAWEITKKRTPPEFFAEHTITDLLTWSDLALEEEGRLTEPLKWDSVTDKNVRIGWADAFKEIAAQLQGLEPKSVVFYASGRASLETAYMYQLMARLYGNNNLPDSSNMCHESTSVGLPQTIGVPVGTVILDDFEHTDCIFFFGQNVGTNSPRMLHLLQDARDRGVPIVTFNPLRERGLVSFVNPLSPHQMLTRKETAISTQYHQVKVGGRVLGGRLQRRVGF
jgi:molybdopterin-dependent oxidoreductase alpha subunit